MRLAASRVHHHLIQVGLLHPLEKAFEVPFVAPVGIALVNHIPFAQPLGNFTSSGARTGHPQ
jgi:hypothetical protein